MAGKRDPLRKRLARRGYRAALALETSFTARRRAGLPRVFYGGARAGSGGGPLVKVARLQEHFPQDRRGYNLVYLLSNTPYLTRTTLGRFKRRKVPMVLNQNGVFYQAWFDGDWRAKNAEMAAAYHMADHVFWQSDFCRRCADRFLGEREGPGEVLYNAVDTGRFTPLGERLERSVTFLVAGKIEHHLYRRIGDALEGLARLRAEGVDAHLVVAGCLDDRSSQHSADDITRLGLGAAVSFTGPYDQDQAPEVFRTADIYLMTKPNDPCPNTVLEALACGLPVIYSATGGVPELVGDEAGWPLACEEDFEAMVWPDVSDLTAAMRDAAQNWQGRAAAARQRAEERYDLAPWIERHRTVFTQLLEQRL